MSDNSTFVDKNWKEIKRQPCNIYTRCMWYLRPVSFFNTGKKTEFYSRKNFKDTSENSIYLRKRENAEFIKQFTPNINING